MSLPPAEQHFVQTVDSAGEPGGSQTVTAWQWKTLVSRWSPKITERPAMITLNLV
nr:hypothetical protein [uncultured Undibacterium sp.]